MRDGRRVVDEGQTSRLRAHVLSLLVERRDLGVAVEVRTAHEGRVVGLCLASHPTDGAAAKQCRRHEGSTRVERDA